MDLRVSLVAAATCGILPASKQGCRQGEADGLEDARGCCSCYLKPHRARHAEDGQLVAVADGSEA
jgi:hypothetical protein